MIVFIGYETSGALRRRFQAAGHETYSCDLLPSEDGGEQMAFKNSSPMGRHLVGDVFETLDHLWANDLWPDLAVFHPPCTYLTNSAAWAFKDGPYHMKVKPGTLVGDKRRLAREKALNEVRMLFALPIRRKVIENPIGVIGSDIRKPSQIIQPYQFGDDASKATCLWFVGKDGEYLPEMALPIDPAKRVPGRRVNGLERWANQAPCGADRKPPSEHRWKDRSRTYPGIADAMVKAWGGVQW